MRIRGRIFKTFSLIFFSNIVVSKSRNPIWLFALRIFSMHFVPNPSSYSHQMYFLSILLYIFQCDIVVLHPMSPHSLELLCSFFLFLYLCPLTVTVTVTVTDASSFFLVF